MVKKQEIIIFHGVQKREMYSAVPEIEQRLYFVF